MNRSEKYVFAITALMFLLIPNGFVFAGTQKYFQVRDICILNIDAVNLVKEGPDFLILNITVEGRQFRTYVGNSPRVDSAVSQVQTGPFLFIQGENVYKRLQGFFPAFIHFMGVNDLAIIKSLALVEVTEKCPSDDTE